MKEYETQELAFKDGYNTGWENGYYAGYKNALETTGELEDFIVKYQAMQEKENKPSSMYEETANQLDEAYETKRK